MGMLRWRWYAKTPQKKEREGKNEEKKESLVTHDRRMARPRERYTWIGGVDLIYLWIRAKCVQQWQQSVALPAASPPIGQPTGDSPRGNTSLGSTVCAIECTLILTNLFLILCHHDGACIEIRRLSTKPIYSRGGDAITRTAPAYGQRSRVSRARTYSAQSTFDKYLSPPPSTTRPSSEHS